MVLEPILLLGGSGLLGKNLHEEWVKQGIIYISPTSRDCDITCKDKVARAIAPTEISTVVHCAALTDVAGIERNPTKAIEVNVVGTSNVVSACAQHNKRIVFISTDYVFDGSSGMYKTTDPLSPINRYAMTKAAAELIVRTYDNSLVIRTTFCPKQFPYERAFVDQYTSRDYVDVIAPLISDEILSKKCGIVHLGTERKTVYDLAVRRKPAVGKISIKELPFVVPQDTSLDIS